MANDFISIDLDAAIGESPRTLYNCLKYLRQAREEVAKVQGWMLHSISLSDYTALETRFGLPPGRGAEVFPLVDGSLQVLDGTSSGYVNELLARLGNSAT